MGSKVEINDAFDSRFLSQFESNDLVSWSSLGGDKEYGFIIQIYFEEMMEGRKFMFAKVKKSDGAIENFMLSSLTKES
jgi:hypothetical protein